jgi:GNAT superfamily N-acetyltransferase
LLREIGQVVPPHDVNDRLDRLRALNGAALIAMEWGPPSGIIALHWYQSVFAPRPAALITLLYVAQEARRRGIARLLLKAGSQAARVAGCDTVMVADTGSGGLSNFCAATGFSQAGCLLARNLRKNGEADTP